MNKLVAGALLFGLTLVPLPAMAQTPTPVPGCQHHKVTLPPSPQTVGVTLTWTNADTASTNDSSCQASADITSGNGVEFTACDVKAGAATSYHCLVIGPHEVHFFGFGLNGASIDLHMRGTAVGTTNIRIATDTSTIETPVTVQAGHQLYLPMIQF